MTPQVLPHSLLTPFDIKLFMVGKHYRLYEKLGSHVVEAHGKQGTHFAVWAPHARLVTVMGDFNTWNRTSHVLFQRGDGSGIWEGFVPGLLHGATYKYCITAPTGLKLDRADPYTRFWEKPPRTASVVWHTYHEWQDSAWLHKRKEQAQTNKKMTVYEMHLNSWRRHADGSPFTYVELAQTLPAYINDLGFTHVELMPVMEHPYDPSWGYQITGFFAPTSRFGNPQDLMQLIDSLHQAGIGVILDWVPSHFPTDAHGLGEYDGTRIYEHPDPRRGYHQDWKSLVFDYSSPQVVSFLISNALFWVDRYHADGLRVDAVASMLYLDYSRKEGEWLPNEYGGRENLDAVRFLHSFNEAVHEYYPDVLTIAEESTAWSGVSRQVSDGGLGFDQKWMMGWMHDTLRYFAREPQYRPWHQNEITFSMVYAFTERFQLPLSHDEVVHGKGSLLGKMPGDEWQKFANLRTLYGYMFSHPGSLLLFMGAELAPYREWNFADQLEWGLLDYPNHKGIYTLIQALNDLQNSYPALWRKAFEPTTFSWISYDDNKNCVLAYTRQGQSGDQTVLVVLNLQPQPLHGYEIGVPLAGTWSPILHTDEIRFGGSGYELPAALSTLKGSKHGHEQVLTLVVPPLSASFWRCSKPAPQRKATSKKTEAMPIKTAKPGKTTKTAVVSNKVSK
jgi:1,4-alpha-glucan branching enzyme